MEQSNCIDLDRDYFEGAPLGQLVYDRTYARVKEDGSKERWPDTVQRVVDGNISFVESKHIEPGEREELYDLLLNRQMIPAGRHLWVTGVKGRAFTQNCHVAGFETGLSEHCAFVFSELMKGGGVGANYSSRYLNALTPLSGVEVRFVCSEEHADYQVLLPLLAGEDIYADFKIPDSREGWVESLTIVLNAAQNGGGSIVFDVSDVRPQGSPIKGFGGISSGPYPLVKLLHAVAELTVGDSSRSRDHVVRVTETYQPVPVTPALVMEIDHLIASAVIAGNVRRSARMSIMHWNDPYIQWFLNCKADHMHHWSTNISVEIDNEFFKELLDEDSHASDVYRHVIEGMLVNGEPGFYNSSLASQGERSHIGATNPCGEMPLESWESCNLGHINLAFGTSSDHGRAFRLMARFLLRATFCDIQDPKQADVVARNRRIGVGFFGLQEWLGLRGIPYSQFNQHGILADHLTEWYTIVRNEANSYADQLGIPRPIKVTTIAPTGTIAKLAGTSEGMQPIYAKYYLRRVRYAENDPEVEKLKAKGIDLEPCIYNSGTLVASFPCEDPILSRVPEEFVEEQHEIDPTVLLELQALIQRYYADNAISLTINLSLGNEVEDSLKKSIKKYLPHVKGMTVFPEASRPQSPIERISKEQYLSMVKAQEINAGTSDMLLDECVGGACPIR